MTTNIVNLSRGSFLEVISGTKGVGATNQVFDIISKPPIKTSRIYMSYCLRVFKRSIKGTKMGDCSIQKHSK